jgi:hypothetical protein
MQLFLKLIILAKHSKCFGRSLHLPSGVQDCTYCNRHMSNRYCYLLLAGTRWSSILSPLSQIIYSCKTHYMFWTVFPSIIRSSRLHIQQQAYVKQILLPAASGDETELLLSASGDEMELSSILSPLSQIIYSCKTLYMFRTVFPSIIRSSRLHIQQQAYVKQIPLPAGPSRPR